MLSIAIGVWIGALGRTPATLAGMFFVLAFGLLKHSNLRRWLILGIIGLLVSLLGLLLRASSFDDLPRNGTYTSVMTIVSDLSVGQGRVIGQSYRQASGRVRVRLASLEGEKIQLSLRTPATLITDSDFPELTPGTTISLAVQVIPRLDQQILLRALTDPEVLGTPGYVAKSAQAIRSGLREAASDLPHRFRGLLPGLVDGDTQLLDHQLVSDMRDTNLTHLTAVSGANLALVASFVIALVRWARVSRRFQPIASALAIAAFVVIARPDPSVMRAAVMAGVLIIASAFELPAVGLTALIAAISLLILFDPSQATKPGFILSVLATGGLLLFATPWTMRLQRYLPKWLALSLATPLAAQALCTPYLVVISGELSLIGVWTNVLASPAVAPATILGFVAGVLSPISSHLASALAWLSLPPLWWISAIAGVGAALPFASVTWFSGWSGVITASILVVGLFLLARFSVRVLLTSYLAFVLVLTALRIFTPGWPMGQWRIAMCDVGQGDAFVIRADVESAVVVDAGPEPQLIDRCLRELRIRHIELLVLTHNHADHVEGVPGVLRQRTVNEVWISPELEPDFEAMRIKQWLVGIPTLTVPLRQPFSTPMMELEAWWPTERINSGSIPNNASIVLSVQVGQRRALFLGDIEAEAQSRLRRQLQGPIDLLKVAHHGSANQDPDLIKDLAPKVALISVGRINPYGHPSPATLRELAMQGARTLRSDRDGAVAISFDTRGLSVRTRGHPWWRRR